MYIPSVHVCRYRAQRWLTVLRRLSCSQCHAPRHDSPTHAPCSAHTQPHVRSVLAPPRSSTTSTLMVAAEIAP